MKKRDFKVRFSFAAKLIFPMVATILLFGGLTSLLVSRLIYNQLLQKEKNQLAMVAMEQAHESAIVLERTQAVIDQIAGLSKTVDYLSSAKPKIQDKELLNLLGDFNIGNSFSAIYLLDASGSAIVSTDDKFIGQNYAFRKYFTQSMVGTKGFDVAVGITTGELGYYLSAPVMVDGQPKGVLVGKMSPNLLLVEIENNEIEKSYFVGLERYMTDEYGVIIFTDKEERLYASLGVLPESLLSMEMRKKRYAKTDLTQLQYQAEMDSILQKKEFFQREFVDEKDKEKEILTTAKVGFFPLYVVMEMSLKQLANSVEQAVLIIGLIVVLAALMTAILLSVLINLWLRPLKIIRQLAMSIADGHLDGRINVPSNDELGDLGRAFNQMADSLVTAKANVEGQVQTRTEELSRLNKFMIGRELKMAELKKQINELLSGVTNEKK